MDFRVRSIGEICTRICSGGTPKSNISEYYNNGSIPWLNTKEVSFNRIRNTEKYITEEGLNNSSAKWISKNSVIVAMYGATAGKSAIAKIPLTTNQACCNLEVNPKMSDYRYVYYWLKNHYEEISSLANGGAQQNLNAGQIRSFPISLPSLENQKKIALILDSIDIKIDLDNRINDYLSEIGSALFSHEILESIDDTWLRASLLDIASYKNGLAMQKYRPEKDDPGLPVLKIKELAQGRCAADTERCRSDIDESVKIFDGDLIFSWSGTLLLDFWAGGNAGLNQHLFKVTSKKYKQWFYYFWTNYHMRKFITLAKDRATTMGHIKRSALAESEVYIPNENKMNELDKLFDPLIKKIISLKIESRILSELRNELLPKLMSGEIDVCKVGVLVERL